ncbi:MAG: aspartyl protease family protein [Mycobacterium sp.]
MGLYTGSGDLEHDGPLLAVDLSISSALQRSLEAQKQHVPQSVRCNGLIDTGSSRTVIRLGLARKLRLNPVSTVRARTASGAEEACGVYSVQLILPNGSTADLTQAVELPLQEPGIDVLIGRDILSQGMLVYLGTKNEFTLCL